MNEQAKLKPLKTKSRQPFGVVAFILLALIIWGFDNFYIPNENGTRVSAQPVPARPHIEKSWLGVPAAKRWSQTALVNQGDNLISILTARGIEEGTADAALDALRTIYDPRGLKVGQKIRIFYREVKPENAPEATTETTPMFDGLDLIPAPTERVIVRRIGADGFKAFTANRPLIDKPFLTDTLITSSLYQAARSTGMPPPLVLELIKMFSFTVDFQREIRDGDRLEVLYTRRFDQNGKVAAEGDILFAALTNRGKRQAYWQFSGEPEGEDERKTFYNQQGQSMARLLLKTPLDGARLTSRYGLRKHPILDYTRVHQGVDFGARSGTPIYAAGDGVVTIIGRGGDWGRRIQVQHDAGYKTFYAHLSRYAKGLKKGDAVKQGQIIGYVGRSGLATGPHLHFEVSNADTPLNPLTLALPPRDILTAPETQAFAKQRQTLNHLIGELSAALNL